MGEYDVVLGPFSLTLMTLLAAIGFLEVASFFVARVISKDKSRAEDARAIERAKQDALLIQRRVESLEKESMTDDQRAFNAAMSMTTDYDEPKGWSRPGLCEDGQPTMSTAIALAKAVKEISSTHTPARHIASHLNVAGGALLLVLAKDNPDMIDNFLEKYNG